MKFKQLNPEEMYILIKSFERASKKYPRDTMLKLSKGELEFILSFLKIFEEWRKKNENY